MIYNEDCRNTLMRDIEYNYVLTSPPDYSELNISPSTNEWFVFLNSWASLLKPKNNLITICTTDRKADGKIYRTDRYNGIVGYCLCSIQQPQNDKTTTGYLGLRFTDFIWYYYFKNTIYQITISQYR